MDLEQVQDECNALEAIYGDEVQIIKEPGLEYVIPVFHTIVHVVIPEGYPSERPPEVKVDGDVTNIVDLTTSSVESIWREMEGEPCVYSLVEHVRTLITDANPQITGAVEEEPESPPIETIETPSEPLDPAPAVWDSEPEPMSLHIPIVSGEPFVDRKSTFQAHCGPVHSKEDCDAFMAQLLQSNKIARATHNIMAYRFYDSERDVQCADNDEDGEDAAGARLAELLDLMGANDVIVVVSRWFGGIKLGPDRFRHINNVARNLLVEQGYQDLRDQRTSKKGKKNKRKP